jgi:branched-chain amino acid aminotransferase
MPVQNRAALDFASLGFAYHPTDKNVRYRWRDGTWDAGEETDAELLPLHIAATSLHYGQAAFEGLKIYEARDGRVLGFRMDDNAARLQHSAELLMMAAPPTELFREAVLRAVAANQRFIPPYGSGATLYVRPLLIGTGPRIGVGPADEYLFLVMVTPVGPYFKLGFSSTTLIVEEQLDRAAPHGVGSAKAAGNYGAGMRATTRAKQAGYGEALYLDARDHQHVDELGAANFFGITADRIYVTPDSPSVLRSITNASLRTLAPDLGYRVEHRPVPVDELERFVEAGACGTAAVITPIERIRVRGKDVVYLPEGKPGPHCTAFYRALTAIQHGDAEDQYGWTEEIALVG